MLLGPFRVLKNGLAFTNCFTFCILRIHLEAVTLN